VHNIFKHVALCALIGLFSTISVSGGPIDAVKKIIDPEWLKTQTLDKGFMTSLWLTQAVTGMTEGYHFSQETKHIVTEQNYHAFETVRRGGWMITGWFEYANMVDDKQSRLDKFRRMLGGAIRARNAFEWSYKLQRYGNPFDYSEKHNAHAVVYVGYREGSFKDLYIGTGPVSGPLVDIAFEVIGRLIYK
jgi:hypothetical protein